MTFQMSFLQTSHLYGLSDMQRSAFRRYNEPAKLEPKEKHPYKVNVWAGISTRGTTDMAIFTGITRKEF